MATSPPKPSLSWNLYSACSAGSSGKFAFATILMRLGVLADDKTRQSEW